MRRSSFELYGLWSFATFDEWTEYRIRNTCIMVSLGMIYGTSHTYHESRVLLWHSYLPCPPHLRFGTQSLSWLSTSGAPVIRTPQALLSFKSGKIVIISVFRASTVIRVFHSECWWLRLCWTRRSFAYIHVWLILSIIYYCWVSVPSALNLLFCC